MSGAESGQFFTQNAELATSRIYKSIVDLLPGAISDPAVKQDVVLFGKNIGEQLTLAGSKAVSDPEFYKAVANALEKTMTQATTQAFKESLPKIQKQITTIAAFGGEINRGDRGQRISLSRASQQKGFGYQQGMVSYKGQTLTSQLKKQGFNQGSQLSISAIEGAQQGAATKSPSKKTIKVGQDIARGLEVGMSDRQDDVARAGTSLASAAVGGVREVPFRAPGQPGYVASNAPKLPGVPLSDITEKARRNRQQLLALQQEKRTQALNTRMNSLNKAFMGGTFALSALSGVASMAGGNLGKFSEILFQISGPLFALSSVLQLLTGQKIIGLISKFKVAFGLASVALVAGVGVIKLVNDARKKELEYIYGLSNAMKTTTDQVKTLGDFFGIVPTKLPFEGRNREIVGKTTRSARDTLRADQGFQKQFASTIKTLSSATAKEASLAFTTLALNLKAQGFASEQVQTIIDALREEAGKTSVKLDVKSLDFSAESIKGLQSQIAPIVTELERNLKTRLTGSERILSGLQNALFGRGFRMEELTNASQKSLSDLAGTISSVSNSAVGMFKGGLISGEDFNATMFGILETTKNLNTETQRLVLLETFKKLDIDAAPFLANIKGINTQMRVFALLSAGVVNKESGLFKLLQSSDYEDQQRGRKELIRLYDELFGAITKVTQAEKNSQDQANDPGNIGKLNALQEKTKAIKEQTNAFIILRNAQIDEATATELSNDAAIASLIITNGKGTALKNLIKLVNEYKAAIKAQADAESKYMEAPNLFKQQLEKAQAQATLREKLIDMEFAPKIKKENDALRTQEQNLQNINDAIDNITATQIKPIQAIIDANNFALEKISMQEDIINEKYNKQIDALDKIATINQDIANTQRQRISIADALTRGDISAAAFAVQELRAQQAQSAVSKQKDALTTSRDSKIAALGRLEIEKQNKELQLQISTIERDKLLTLQTQKETVEASIEATNRNIKSLELQVNTLKDGALYSGQTKKDIDELDDLIKAAEAAGIPFNDLLLKQAGNAASLAKALNDALIAQQNLASFSGFGGGSGNTGAGNVTGSNTTTTTTKTGSTVTVKSGNTLSGIAAKAGVKLSDVIKANPQISNPNLIRPGQIIKIPGKMYGGKIKSMNMGGMVPKYMARGGSIGSDTVPTMLTPGEFIMNRRATEQFGPMLSMLNESKYPSMIGNRGVSQVPVNNISTSMSDNSTAVYNYNLGFSINGASANANDIARAVMKEIKNVDAQRVRGQRQ
jgi:LysM repeat protein